MSESVRMNPFPVLQEVKFPERIEEQQNKMCLEELISKTFEEVKQQMCDNYCRYTCATKSSQGAKLKELIQQTGLNQKSFTAAFAIWLKNEQREGRFEEMAIPTEGHFSRWIHDTVKMRDERKEMFAEYFGVDKSYFDGETRISDAEIEDLWDSDICNNCPLNDL